MNLALILRVLKNRSILRKREKWRREDVLAFQHQSLQRLRAHAYQHSTFYRNLHKGLEKAPLHELPIVKKEDLMAAFDSAVTDSTVKLSGVLDHADRMTKDERYLGRYWVSATSGTTGRRGAFLWNNEEWAWVIAAYARAYEWSGIHIDLFHPRKIAVVSSRVPWHQSSLLGASVDSPVARTLRVESSDPMENIVTKLNQFQPHSLVGYASMLDQLAEEQQAGTLKIAPQVVLSASEVLSDEAKKRIHNAWQREPFDIYCATEAATLASQCSRHKMHSFEDLVIMEVVDENYKPVAPGECGKKVLVTPLFSSTLPLIRYEMSDNIQTTVETCGCSLPFHVIGGVEGRIEDTLVLMGTHGGKISVRPNLFHNILVPRIEERWQVVQRGETILIRVLGKTSPEDKDDIRTQIATEITRLGVGNPHIEVENVDQFQRGATGKFRLIGREMIS
jgi:putative adenylate-forming enzyme